MNKQESEKNQMAKDSNNVILFPHREDHRTTKPKDLDEVYEKYSMIREMDINEAVSIVGDKIFEMLGMSGYIFDDDSVKDGVYIMESIKAVLMRKEGLYHPFHEYIDKAIEEDENNNFVIDLTTKVVKKRKKKAE